MSKYIDLNEATDLFKGIDATMTGGWVADTLEALPTIEVSEEDLKGCDKVDKRFSEDCISKGYLEQEIENQAMTVEKDKEYWRGWNNALDKVVELIESAPSVVPSCQKNRQVERAEGEWIESEIPNELYVCSECGGACWSYDYERNIVKSNYCPNCGAKMKR